MAVPKALSSQSLPAWANTVGRAVHVKIHPQPRNLAESTEVLRQLQQYGEVIMYKHLKHEPNLHAPNTALAIFQSTDSAEEAINASPIRFELGKLDKETPLPEYGSSMDPQPFEESQHEVESNRPTKASVQDTPEWVARFAKSHLEKQKQPQQKPEDIFTSLNDTNSPHHSHSTHATTISTPPSRTPKPFTPNPNPSNPTSPTSLPYPPSPNSTLFPHQTPTPAPPTLSLHITRSSLNHYAYIQRQHYYGPFRLDKKSFMADDLEERVPVRGMMDVQLGKGEVPLRMRQKREERRERERRGGLMELWERGEEGRRMDRERRGAGGRDASADQRS